MNIPAKNKYLLFVEDADNQCLVQAEDIQSINSNASGTAVKVCIKGSGVSGDVASVTLTVPDEAASVFLKALANEISFGNSAVITVADEVNSVFFSNLATGTTINHTA